MLWKANEGIPAGDTVSMTWKVSAWRESPLRLGALCIIMQRQKYGVINKEKINSQQAPSA
jgi:hypothetical protein